MEWLLKRGRAVCPCLGFRITTCSSNFLFFCWSSLEHGMYMWPVAVWGTLHTSDRAICPCHPAHQTHCLSSGDTGTWREGLESHFQRFALPLSPRSGYLCCWTACRWWAPGHMAPPGHLLPTSWGFWGKPEPYLLCNLGVFDFVIKHLTVRDITVHNVINFLTFNHVLYIILLHYNVWFQIFVLIFFIAEHSKLERQSNVVWKCECLLCSWPKIQGWWAFRGGIKATTMDVFLWKSSNLISWQWLQRILIEKY